MDLGVKSRNKVYINAKAVYCKVCSDHLRFSHTVDEIGNEIGLSHGDVCYHANTSFAGRLNDDIFAEFYIEINDQVKAAKKVLKQTAPVLQLDAKEEDPIEQLIAKLTENEIKYNRLRQNVSVEWLEEVIEMTPEQLAFLHERIKPAIIRTKNERNS